MGPVPEGVTPPQAVRAVTASNPARATFIDEEITMHASVDARKTS
jgi:hypothetical protein